MKTIIKITKQEAIDAYRSLNGMDKNAVIEIEEEVLPKFYPGTQYLSGISSAQCTVCGDFLGNAIHNCRGYKITANLPITNKG